MRPYLTAQEIAALVGVPVNRVYWLAHRDGWRRTDHRPQRYIAADVLTSLASPDTPDVNAA